MRVAIIDAYRDQKPPSSPRGELEGSMVVAIIDAFPGKKGRPAAPMMGARGRPCVFVRRHNPQISGEKGPPSSPHDRGARGRPGGMPGRQIRDLPRRAFATMIRPRRNADWGRFAASGGHERNAKSPGDAAGCTSGTKQICRMPRAKSSFLVDICPHYIGVWGRFAASAILAGK